MRAADLVKKLEDQPFKPFRIHLSDGTRLDVRHAGMVIVGLSSAVVPSRFGTDEQGHRIARDWRTIALAHIVRFSDLNGSSNGRRRPRRRKPE